MSPSFSSLSPPSSLILLALRVPRTFSSQQERRRLLSYGALHAARWEEGRATTIAAGQRGRAPPSLLLSLAAVTFILFTLSWQAAEAARGK